MKFVFSVYMICIYSHYIYKNILLSVYMIYPRLLFYYLHLDLTIYRKFCVLLFDGSRQYYYLWVLFFIYLSVRKYTILPQVLSFHFWCIRLKIFRGSGKYLHSTFFRKFYNFSLVPFLVFYFSLIIHSGRIKKRSLFKLSTPNDV